MIRLASSEVHATNGKRSGPTSKPRWLRTALTGAGLGTEKRALTLGMNLRWIAAVCCLEVTIFNSFKHSMHLITICMRGY